MGAYDSSGTSRPTTTDSKVHSAHHWPRDVEAPMSEKRIAFPKTRGGWAALLWLVLRRCPQCHGPLQRDWALYDDGQTLYCLLCGGLILPRGMWRALAWNRRAEVSDE